MRIEVLFPDVANLHGDVGNMNYLQRCRPDAEIIRTHLRDHPAFARSTVDMVYMGAMPEYAQVAAIERLHPYISCLTELIEAGTVFLFTHNAMEVMGDTLTNVCEEKVTPGLGIFPMTSTIDYFHRYTGKVMGDTEGTTIVGYKSQFSMLDVDESVPGFFTATRGIGRNRTTPIEGVRVNNFIGTSLVGPLLVMNPEFTTRFLGLIDPHTEPRLAFRPLAMQAYVARLKDFNDPDRWHADEKTQSAG